MTQFLIWYVGLGIIGAALSDHIYAKYIDKKEHPKDRVLGFIRLVWVPILTFLTVLFFITRREQTIHVIRETARVAKDRPVNARYINVVISLSLIGYLIFRLILGIE